VVGAAPIVPDVSPVPRTWSIDWATGSIGLSIAGALVTLIDPGLFIVGVVLFGLGLISGVVALRIGKRRNLAAVGVILNTANLVFDGAVLIIAASR
jgi:hypothetical protein